MYTSLNDAAANTGNPAYAKGATKIWYMKDESWRDFSMGAEWLREHPDLGTLPTNEAQLRKSHTLLGSIAESNKDRIFGLMQGENWSPRGEARNLIQGKGLRHTSMSVGDIIQVGPFIYMVDRDGFEKLNGWTSGGKRRHGVIAPAQGKCSRCGKPMLWSKSVTGWDPKQGMVTLMHARCAKGIGKYPADAGSIEKLAGDVGRMLKR
jgi:hypothetical protein